MYEQTAARLRMVEARLAALEMAVRPKPIRRTRTGLPRPPEPWMPGEAEPITDWLAMRLTAAEHVIGFVLRADMARAEDEGTDSLAEIADGDLMDVEAALAATKTRGTEFGDRLFRAMVAHMRTIMDDQMFAPEIGGEDAP